MQAYVKQAANQMQHLFGKKHSTVSNKRGLAVCVSKLKARIATPSYPTSDHMS